MNDIESIAENIGELRDKLRRGESIKATSWVLCPCEEYRDCPKCNGIGKYSETTELFQPKGEN